MQMLMRYRDLALPVAIIASLMVILVPLPPWLIDLLLAANIAVGVLVLLTTIWVTTPLEFSIFPSLLLVSTLARLGLNVATTRLILTGAESANLDAAGGMIRGFGEFVAGDRLEVGLIIFMIIVLIQFIVITKGSTRISEVAARFALDGMPGRQMAIDADLNAGSIDEGEARRRRQEVSDQADFYAAMDGASKFVRGDAIAGLAIMAINVMGGFWIGIVRMKKPPGEVIELFTKLTIGDGLVNQVPALLISLAAGMLVTRGTTSADLPRLFLSQLFGSPRALLIAGAFMLVMIFTRLPALPMATLGFGCVGLALVMNRHTTRERDEAAERELAERVTRVTPAKRVEDYLAVDPMEMAIGLGLLGLADPARGGDLMERIAGVRNLVAADIGIILPKVRVRDDATLGENEYEIRIAGNPVARATVDPERWLAIVSGTTTGAVEGEPATEPVSGKPAIWIHPSRREQAAIYGYLTLPAGAVLARHLQDVVRRHADELLTRDATKQLLDELRRVSPAAVDELIPGVMKLADVQQVLQWLLREDVPIRQLGMIIETLGDQAGKAVSPLLMVEAVRHRLARTISGRYRDSHGRLHVVAIAPELEDRIAAGIEQGSNGISIRISPQAMELTCERIEQNIKNLIESGYPPVMLVSPRIRLGLKQMTAAWLPRLTVLSYNDVTSDTPIESHGVVTDLGSVHPMINSLNRSA